MTYIDILKADAEYAFGELIKSLEDTTERQAWAVLPNLGADYLHTDGSIHAIIHHVAGCKKVNGSVCFRSGEYRWRDLFEEVQTFEPNWERALEFLNDAHRYWMESWADLTDDRLTELRPTNWSSDRTVVDILRIVSQHDSYHAGQIAVLRYGAVESAEHPPSISEDILKYCRDLPYW